MSNNVTTYHYDNARTGWNPNEFLLTPQFVSSNFGLMFRYDSASGVVDDVVHAQPLYMQNLRIGGVAVNAVFLATRSGTVYAFDADNWRSGTSPWLWKTSLVDKAAGEEASGDRPLLATPVIDPTPLSGASQGVMYVVGRFEDRQGNCYFRLHALDVATGKNVSGLGPVKIDKAFVPTVSGTGDPQTAPESGQVFFDPKMHYNRPALLLANKTVYVAFGSTGDVPPYHGWVLGFRTSDLQLVGSFCTTPDSTNDDSQGLDTLTLGGSVWQAGFGIAADNGGFVYCMTANGLFGSRAGGPQRNYADSLLQLTADVKLSGTFTPPNPQQLTEQDCDFGSAGPLGLPDGVGGGNFIVGCGKDAVAYLIDRAHLPGSLNQTGNYRSKITLAQNSEAHPITNDGSGPGVWGGPAYFGGAIGNVIYYCGDHGPLQALAIANGTLTPALTSASARNQTPPSEEFPSEGGTIPVVTSNGSTPATGVVWCITRPDGNNQLHLRAYDAADLTKGHLFDAAIGPWSIPGGGTGAFLVPVAVNGKVYVGSDRQLSVYGPFPFPREGSPLDGYSTAWNDQQHVNYIGRDGQMHELVYKDGSGWENTFLSQSADAPSLAAGNSLDGYVTPWNNQQHVNYIGQDGHVHELVYKDGSGWGHTDLSQSAHATNALPLAGSPLDGYATPWNNQQHVNYIGQDGHVHELVYKDGSGWGHTDLSHSAGTS